MVINLYLSIPISISIYNLQGCSTVNFGTHRHEHRPPRMSTSKAHRQVRKLAIVFQNFIVDVSSRQTGLASVC